MFAGLAIFFSFAVLFNAATQLSIAELWILWLGTLLAVRYGLHSIFHRISVHRGIWHSILAAVFCAIVTAIVFYHLLNKPAGVAWLAAAFMFLGYMTHLTLDEIYSVDVMDTRLKSSFGTALKLFDRRHFYSSVAMAAATFGAIVLSPPTRTFVDGLGSRDLWSGLEHRLLPTDKWFGLVDGPYLAHRQEVTSPSVETSSIGRSATEQKVPEAPSPASAATGQSPSDQSVPADAPAQPIEPQPANGSSGGAAP
jgi:hypothetical protein